MHALEMRLVPVPGAADLGRPAGDRPGAAAAAVATKPANRRRPAAGPERRQARATDRPPRPCGRARARADVGPMPGRSCSTRKPATRSRGFSAKRSSASMSLTWAASRNLSPPNFTNGMLRRVELDLERGRCDARCGTAPPAASAPMPPSRFSSTLLDDVARPGRPRRAR